MNWTSEPGLDLYYSTENQQMFANISRSLIMCDCQKCVLTLQCHGIAYTRNKLHTCLGMNVSGIEHLTVQEYAKCGVRQGPAKEV